MWNKPGGFAAFPGGWIPDDDWDNTKRDWFVDAKQAKGQIAFSEPYVDSDTNDVIITLSMTVFNGEGSDLGVVADDVTVNVLKDIINSTRSFPGQEMYIINPDGLFITHEDINAVMEMDGWNTYERIKAISGLHNIPIAFFTSSNDPKDIKHAQEIGAVDYIKKPYNNDDLLRRIAKILKK